MAEITIPELLAGKATTIKGKEFLPTKEYVEPFLEQMSKFTDDFKVEVKLPQQMTIVNDEADITFNRVLVQAKLPESYCIDSHDEVIGFLYGLDVRKPIVSIYKGHLNQACTNLTIFNSEWVRTYELIVGDPINYAPIKELMETTNDFHTKLERIKKMSINREDSKLHLGNWIDNTLRMSKDTGFGKVKISAAHAIEAYKKLFVNQDSPYYVPEGIDNVSIFDVYNSFTQVITDDKKDIMQKANKTLLLSEILNLN